jgi:hypothetical protein
MFSKLFHISDIDSNYWIKKEWKKLMTERKIRNGSNKTFTISEILRPNNEIKLKLLLKTPVGLIIEHLDFERKFIDSTFGGDSIIDWDYKNDCIQVTITKKHKSE